MNVIKVSPRGFCLGVVKSIKTAQDTVKKYCNKSIYMIGLIVHNKLIVQELEELGIIVIDDWKKDRLEIIKEIPQDSVVIFSAHGTSQEVIKKAQERDLIVVDTKCEWVLETEIEILKYLDKGFDVIFIGKSEHPETIALTSLDKERIHLITSFEDVENLDIKNKNLIATNQTTLSIVDTEIIYKKLEEKFKDIIVKNDICQATYIRQKAILDLNPKNIDLLYVVGDERSNNTQKLAELSRNKGIKTILINRKEDIDLNDLENVKNVAVTAGASTSSLIQSQFIKFLEEL